MTARTLSGLLITLGAAALVIGASIFLIGASATGQFTEGMFIRVTGSSAALTGRWSATAESEMRFYAALWIAYGWVLIATARDLPRRTGRVPVLMAVFFAGGIGRAIAYVQVGPPHPAFSLLMAIELVFPILALGLWARVRTEQAR